MRYSVGDLGGQRHGERTTITDRVADGVVDGVAAHNPDRHFFCGQSFPFAAHGWSCLPVALGRVRDVYPLL